MGATLWKDGIFACTPPSASADRLAEQGAPKVQRTLCPVMASLVRTCSVRYSHEHVCILRSPCAISWRPRLREYSANDRLGLIGATATRMEAPPAFVFHSANAYEDGSRVVVDCVCYQRMPDFEQVRTVCAAVLPKCEVGLHRICAASAVKRSNIHNILWSTGVVLGDARRLAI